ncbi:hypothetical protein TPHA_0B02810 [Tetrapisispora phaffii CBS 4417]|uniref:SWIRM domain-containing protein n=1 Tax=Tetrapisispora phaffii (strain ATCC 24235 / CBS 4417 / NBRC 1672 / NRRL Y-8282 / UCD 70-5) TaxID=1071381 RepID=G8BPM2_TETPH|nr:hypothetical protein TPHA_0B02810 [Tetrapisispora phaffii CBS 4417]CCE61953.1 hypothetical protein TPHA_0B02810 [Tetrapisispora phaffii CBS 4417]
MTDLVSTVAADGVANVTSNEIIQTKVEPAPAKVNYEEEATKLENKSYRFLAKQVHPVIIPSYASWFDFSKINDIERKAIPDFFDGSANYKTPTTYKDTRNFLINTYRLTPYEYLTMTAVRQNLGLDVTSIFKIHAFLEKWGLINYQLDPKTKPSSLSSKYKGHYEVVLDTADGLKPFIKEEIIEDKKENENKADAVEQDKEKPILSTINNDVKFTELEKFPINLSLETDVYNTLSEFISLEPEDRLKKKLNRSYICHTCGNDTVFVRYHNLRARDINICSRCYQEGHFGANFQASDFIRIDNNTSSMEWTEQEIFLLLEGIELYEDQWQRIVQHIGTERTVVECVEKFLKLPIEDSYINDAIGKLRSKYSNNTLEGSNTTKEEQIENAKNVISGINHTVEYLIDGQNDEVLKKMIPESANKVMSKYLKEAQIVTHELINLSAQGLNIRIEELKTLEKALIAEFDKLELEKSKLADNRKTLNDQVDQINEELKNMNITNTLTLVSQDGDLNKSTAEKSEDLYQTSDDIEKKKKESTSN